MAPVAEATQTGKKGGRDEKPDERSSAARGGNRSSRGLERARRFPTWTATRSPLLPCVAVCGERSNRRTSLRDLNLPGPTLPTSRGTQQETQRFFGVGAQA